MAGKYWIAIAMCLLAAGCGEGPSGGDTMGTLRGEGAPPSSALTGRDWMLMRLEGEEVAPLSDGRRPNLRFEADRVHGFAGCNRLTGGYRIEGTGLEFAQLAMTRMACAEGMDLEQRFSAVLERVTGYELAGDRLVLSDTGGAPLAVFASEN